MWTFKDLKMSFQNWQLGEAQRRQTGQLPVMFLTLIFMMVSLKKKNKKQKTKGKCVFSKTSVESVQNWWIYTKYRYHWSITPMEGYIEGVILLFTIIVVSSLGGTGYQCWILADMKMGRDAKMLGDKGSIQNYAVRLKECSGKCRMDWHWAKYRVLLRQEKHLYDYKTVLQFW